MTPQLEIATTTGATWLLSGQFAEDQPVRHIRVDRFPFVVGRKMEASLSIPSPTVSSSHAEITVGDDVLIVRDLGSTNGTFVNGVRITEPTAVKHGDLLQFAQVVFRACATVRDRSTKTVQDDSSDRALALIQFDKLMTERAVAPHYQPIVAMDDCRTLGYEVLGRSPLFGLTTPHSMFATAAVLELEGELSRIFREEGIVQARQFPPDAAMFVNTHPAEMEDLDLLIFSLHQLRQRDPHRPIVLEIHEASATHHEHMAKLRASLGELHMQMAYDDFGAGRARLVELVEVPPDYLKFDMKLIQGLSSASLDRKMMVAHLVQMVSELGIIPLAEGIETPEDHGVCRELGFQVAQGYFYGRPGLPREYVSETH
jgi:EAL domain-containing protein (putative c-di-GMP-specific phosphodiesterase class I)